MASLLQVEQERENRTIEKNSEQRGSTSLFLYVCFWWGGGGETPCSKSWRENPKDRIPESEILTTSEGRNLSGKRN